MARAAMLSGNFPLREVPYSEKYSDEDVVRLQETVALVLQPIRTRWGRTRITSGKFWSDGRPRTGAHEDAGTVDFVTLDAPIREVWEWGAVQLVPGGYIGRWIYEPARASGRRQGEHIHVAPRRAMREVFGDPVVQVLEETEEGVYALRFQAAAAFSGVFGLLLAGGLLLGLRGRHA